MGRVKSKTTKNNHKKRNIVVAVVVVVILAAVLLMASNPHPGYSQLEKELDKITFPEGWTEVGPRTGEKDFWNMFCSDVTIKCPSIAMKVKVDESVNLETFSNTIQEMGYRQVAESKVCLQDKTRECLVSLENTNIQISFSTRDLNKSSGIGYVYISQR